MTSRLPVSFTLADRDVAFTLVVDAGSVADQNTARAIEVDGCCEPEVSHLMARVVREGDSAIDVGANVGFFTLLLGRLVGSTGNVTAFEPTPASFNKLRENVRLNRLPHVSCMQQALWHKPEEVTLHMSQDSGLNALARAPTSVGVLKLQATTLDAAMGLSSCRLLKMDAEGAEEHIICGCRWVSPLRVPYIVSELNDEALQRFDSSAAKFRTCMDVRGYSTFLLHQNGAFPTLIPRTTSLQQGSMANVNVLFSTIELVSEAWPEIQL